MEDFQIPDYTTRTSTSSRRILKLKISLQMSTYLVAYANGRFAYLESSYKSPLSGKTRPLRIYCRDPYSQNPKCRLM
jgi:aminopeptidase N